MSGEAVGAEAPKKTTLTVTVDGRAFEANPGELLIAAAERQGTYIPRFCWHPRMREVGMCRMCLIEVDGPRGPALLPACMLPVTEGMIVHTKSDTVKKAQDGVLEFLLINHPLDCPVCDKGGECPLQDQTLTFGPGETRFVEEKRHYEKPIAISELVYLDRERCILCDRCTRFSKEVAGDPLISFVSRGNMTEVNTFPEDPFSSYFSGNVVQICPVGALTAKPYRFAARPWDLDQVESTCTTCAVGCRVVMQSSGDRITRYQGVDSSAVNWGWLCDKGRFDFESTSAPDRLTHPQMRSAKGAALEKVTWYDAMAAAASALRGVSPERIAVLGGSRLTNEAAYAWAKLAKGVLRTDNVDAQMADGLSAEEWLGLPPATIDDLETASAVLVMAPDLKEQLPILFLRLRDAAVNHNVAVFEVGPKATGISSIARHGLFHRPGEAASAIRALLGAAAGTPLADHNIAGIEADALTVAGAALKAEMGKGTGKLVVIFGRPNLAESAAATSEALAVLAARTDTTFLPALRRSNLRGALELGLAPGVMPGRVSLADSRGWFAERWPAMPAAKGKDTNAILHAAAHGEIDVVILLGCDPVADVADHQVKEALAGIKTVIAVDTLPNATTPFADIVLPAAGYGEVCGTTTNLEGRVTRLAAKISAPGTARPDWMIAVELASHLDTEFGVESSDQLTAEIGRTAPSYMGLTVALASGDGVLMPLASGADDDESAPALPALMHLVPTTVTAAAPSPDAYSLRLVVSHVMYGHATMVAASASLAKLVVTTSLQLHPGEVERHALREGGLVKIVNQAGATVTLAIRANPSVPRGTAFIAAGPEAAQLIDHGGGVTKIRLEGGP